MKSPQRSSDDLEAGGDAPKSRNHSRRRGRGIFVAVDASIRFKSAMGCEKEIELGSHDQPTAKDVKLSQLEEQPVQVEIELPASYPDEFGIRLEELVSISCDGGLSVLKRFDGVSGLSPLLHTDLDKGICGTHEDIRRRRNKFGSNEYPLKKERNFWMFLGEASRSFTLIVLVLAALASLLLQIKTKTISHEWYDEAGIIVAVILVIFVTAISNYNQSLQFEKLNDEKRNICIEVTRNGRLVEVPIYDVVVGDIIPLKSGDQVPADGVLVSGYSLQIGEYETMGTNRTVHKDTDIDPILISGSKVEDGIGRMLVTSVGMNTQWRMPMACIPLYTGEETPLQVHLNRVVIAFGLISISVALVVFLIESCLCFMGRTKNTDGSPMFDAGKTTLDEKIDMVIKFIILGVTIIVVAVPEGLPLAVTLNIAYMTRKLLGEKVLVQKLSACEAMGSATTIVCHKTGILTLNQMEVVDVCAGRVRTHNLDTMAAELSPLLISLITEGIALNTNGSVYHPEGQSEPEVFGSATERAILNFGVKQLGMNFDEIKSKSTIFRVSPFNSRRKRRGVAVQLHDSQVRVHWKGAAKTILASCQWYMDKDNIAAMDQEKRFYFEKTIDEMSKEGLRCAALAYRKFTDGDIPESNLVLLAIIGIKDSCRPGISRAIQQCRNAGVKVCMVTGDDLLTAKAIAMQCGILRGTLDEPANTAILASEFASMSEADREEIAENIVVMGRSSPDENLLLLEALRKKGHVVAATGKGIRDAPSLRQANISLAMGIGGTAIVKECSDIIILEDNFTSIVKVIQWGRFLYTNAQRFLQFRLTVNASALIICVVVAVHSHEIPLNVAQLLWINLLTFTFGAWALASEPPMDNLMRRPPVRKGGAKRITWFCSYLCEFLKWMERKKSKKFPISRSRTKEPFITKLMWAKFVAQVSFQVSALLYLNFRGESILKLENKSLDQANKVKNTVIFNCFVFCQVFNEVECRTSYQGNTFSGILKNHLFLGTILLNVILQVPLHRKESSPQLARPLTLVYFCAVKSLVVFLSKHFLTSGTKIIYKT
ncbi:PREDICTED: calcium-transporting ATPase 8, plasma membrane-type-like isoform X3 [Brassica oleracea var. oleracea]|uniref:calcium-transporting ATPase 8, plasma membrane-type-like isoform X3 n=1 Tax=Brassica oleracea var. oleracea TaxID=109376 RepID=UPI0006A756EA|nr:PREDICTED: calcium-transporting ATPase 8, plasma membrane-type-like isoform X3 [Brassica oleracea var. oleracea]XP_013600129.1 PREDICTED: calcium-transporting ATPase 8, plasma membrane-type-like isoform X3 [Brassica oleracea var. oleracea]